MLFRLIIKNVDIAHQGDYKCIASNEVGTCSTYCELFVEELSSRHCFKKQLSDSEIIPNKEVELSIEVQGDPSVTWFKDEVPIKGGDTSKYEMDSKQGKYTLRFTPTEVEDEGKYKVVEQSKPGQNSSVAKLTFRDSASSHAEAPIQKLEVRQDFVFPEVTFEIKNEPEFVTVPKDIKVNENDLVVLRCSVAGNPVPEIKWFNAKKEEIPEQGRVRHETKDGYSSLVIEDANLKDEGLYICSASNPSGEVSNTVEVLVDEVQPYVKPITKPDLKETPVVCEKVDKVYMEPTETELR